MAKRYQRDGFTWLAYFILAIYSYFLNILGPITPFLKSEMQLSYTISSLHFSAFAAGILLAGLAGHLVVERWGRWRSLWAGTAGLSLGALLLITGGSPLVTITAAFVMGSIGSLILVIIPAALSDQQGELRAVALSEANVVASLIATAAPLLVGWFVQLQLGWRPALGVAALVPLALYALFGKVNPPAAAGAGPAAPQTRSSPAWFWVYWAAIVLAVSTEFCMISWSADFLSNRAGLTKAASAQAVSVFFVAMILGRLAASRLVQRISAPRLVGGFVLVASAGFVLFWTSASAVWAIAGLFVTGLGVSGLYPLLVALAIEVSTDAVRASARTTLASGTAILALPLTLGRLADSYGIRQAYSIVFVLLAGIFLIILARGLRRLKKNWAAPLAD